MKDWTCAACGCSLAPRERVGRRDTCPGCGAELHSCRQCAFRDPSAYNECGEPQAERVLDKDRSNFCEYFTPRSVASAAAEGKRGGSGGGPRDSRDARADLEALFRKK